MRFALLEIYSLLFTAGFIIFSTMADKPDVSAVASFDKKKLKHTEVKEKNPLPTAESKSRIMRRFRFTPPNFVFRSYQAREVGKMNSSSIYFVLFIANQKKTRTSSVYIYIYHSL